MTPSPQHAAYLERLCPRFETMKDDKGNLLHPFFSDVQVAMGDLMAHDPALSRMPDGIEKMMRAYAMVVETVVTEAETAELLQNSIQISRRS